MDIENLFIIAIMYATGGMFFVGSLKMPELSGAYPRYIALTVIILTTIQLVSTLRSKKDPDLLPLDPAGLKRASVVFVGSLVYILLMGIVGFFVMTAIYLLVMLWLFEVRKLSTMAIVTVSMVVFIYVGFKVLFGVPVPEGILI